MAVRNHEEVWNFDLNYTPTDTLNSTNFTTMLFDRICSQWLPAAGWTPVLGCLGVNSSSPVVAGIPWAVYTDIKISGTWVVFKSPEGIVKGLDGSGLGDQSCLWVLLYITSGQVQVSVSRTAFTGGAWNARPTSPNVSYNDASFNITTEYGLASFAQQKSSFWYTTNGSFILKNSKPSDGLYSASLSIIALKDITFINSIQKYHPFGIYIGLISSTTNSDDKSKVWVTALNSYVAKGWDLTGAVCNNIISADATASGLIGTGEGNNGNGLNLDASMSWMYVYTATGPNLGKIGRIPDITITGAILSQGAVDDQATPKWCVSGNLLLPVNAALMF